MSFEAVPENERLMVAAAVEPVRRNANWSTKFNSIDGWRNAGKYIGVQYTSQGTVTKLKWLRSEAWSH